MIHEENGSYRICCFVGVEYCSLSALLQFLNHYVICVVLNWYYNISSGL